MSLATADERVRVGTPAPPDLGREDCEQVPRRAGLRKIAPLLSGTGYTAESWRTYNRSFFDALFMEKLMMMVLVGLIFIVVGFNVFHSLRRSVHERMEEIAVLKAVGIPPGRIQAIFVLEGLLIGLAGAVSGLLAGLGLAVNVNAVFAGVDAVINGLIHAVHALASVFAHGGSGGSVRNVLPSVFLPYPGALPRLPAGGLPRLLLCGAGMHGRRVGRLPRRFQVPSRGGAAE